MWGDHRVTGYEGHDNPPFAGVIPENMGIEFTGLDQATQKQLQQQVEVIAVESPEIGSGAEITMLGSATEHTRST